MDIGNKIFNGHVIDILKTFDENSVDCVVTSSPYYSMRNYDCNAIWDETMQCEHEFEIAVTDKSELIPISNKAVDYETFKKEHRQGFCKKCGAWYGELGQEPTPSLFIKHIVDVMKEVKRVLKPTGLLFYNIGDTYCGSASGFADKTPNIKSRQSKFNGYFTSSVMAPPAFSCVGKEPWLKAKQLMLIPSRIAIAMQDDGWLLRQQIIWKKRSGLPSTANDRFDSKYEYIFMFSKSPTYFFDTNNARKPYEAVTLKRKNYVQASFGGNNVVAKCAGKGESEPMFQKVDARGALKSDVWDIGTANLKLKHFAAYSSELVENCIKPGCAKEVCVSCGKPKMERYKIKVRNFEELDDREKGLWSKIDSMELEDELKNKMKGKLLRKKVSLGFLPTCKCNVDFQPGIVLDIFGGSGTTALTAKLLGYKYTSIDMNPEYYNMEKKRLNETL